MKSNSLFFFRDSESGRHLFVTIHVLFGGREVLTISSGFIIQGIEGNVAKRKPGCKKRPQVKVQQHRVEYVDRYLIDGLICQHC